jgi:hypothetical protein
MARLQIQAGYAATVMRLPASVLSGEGPYGKLRGMDSNKSHASCDTAAGQKT